MSKSINVTTISKLIEAHLENDDKKFFAYANFIADYYDENNDYRSAKIIRSRLDGTYKNKENIVTLDGNNPVNTEEIFIRDSCDNYDFVNNRCNKNITVSCEECKKENMGYSKMNIIPCENCDKEICVKCQKKS